VHPIPSSQGSFRNTGPGDGCDNPLIDDSPSHAYAYLLLNPYRPEKGEPSTLVVDKPLAVGERMRRSFIGGCLGPGPERDWEVVAIEPTDRDGEVASIRAYRGHKLPVIQGRLVLRSLG
jgi:hypothetical protein